jgi:hypothetical protein
LRCFFILTVNDLYWFNENDLKMYQNGKSVPCHSRIEEALATFIEKIHKFGKLNYTIPGTGTVHIYRSAQKNMRELSISFDDIGVIDTAKLYFESRY